MRQPTTGKNRSVFLSFARGFAIFTIVLYHYLADVPLPEPFTNLFVFGGSGIYVFLFASGLGLYSSKGTNWADFYRKRFTRVLVPFYIGLTIIFIFNQYWHLYQDGLPEYISSILLYKMFYDPHYNSFGGHFWFISTIVQFYLAWPLILKWINSTTAAKAILIALAVSIGYSIMLSLTGLVDYSVLFRLLPQYIWVLVLGVVAGKHKWLSQLDEKPVLPFVLLFAGGYAAVYLVNNVLGGVNGMLFNDYFMFVGYLSGCYTLYRIGGALPFIRRFILWIEGFSYSLYIMHMFILRVYLHFRGPGVSFYEMPLILLASFGASIAFNRLVDQVMQLRFTRPPAVAEVFEGEQVVK